MPALPAAFSPLPRFAAEIVMGHTIGLERIEAADGHLVMIREGARLDHEGYPLEIVVLVLGPSSCIAAVPADDDAAFWSLFDAALTFHGGIAR